MKKRALNAVLVLAVCGLLPAGARAQKKEMVQLQTNVALLQEQVRELQRSVVERTTVLKTLVEQAVDAVNRMSATVGDLERSVREAQANADVRVGSLATQVQALRDSLDEMSVRVAKLSEKMTETENLLQGLDARLAAAAAPPQPNPALPATSTAPTGAPATPPPAPVPSAETLYTAALRDFMSGKYDLAQQQFADYLKYYADTPLAGNAQFYIGETHYQAKDFQRAIAEYERVLTNYPKSYKIAAALLKKGYSLIELNDREGGIRVLRTLIREHPSSEEAQRARERLQRLGGS